MFFSFKIKLYTSFVKRPQIFTKFFFLLFLKFLTKNKQIFYLAETDHWDTDQPVNKIEFKLLSDEYIYNNIDIRIPELWLHIVAIL